VFTGSHLLPPPPAPTQGVCLPPPAGPVPGHVRAAAWAGGAAAPRAGAPAAPHRHLESNHPQVRGTCCCFCAGAISLTHEQRQPAPLSCGGMVMSLLLKYNVQPVGGEIPCRGSAPGPPPHPSQGLPACAGLGAGVHPALSGRVTHP